MRIIISQLYRCLERLHLAVKDCARIGFQESSPITNAHHVSIWNDLNEAQRDAELKLKYFVSASTEEYEKHFIPQEKARMDGIAARIADIIQSSQPDLQNRYTWEAAYEGARELVSQSHHPRFDKGQTVHEVNCRCPFCRAGLM